MKTEAVNDKELYLWMFRATEDAVPYRLKSEACTM